MGGRADVTWPLHPAGNSLPFTSSHCQHVSLSFTIFDRNWLEMSPLPENALEVGGMHTEGGAKLHQQQLK